MNKKLLFPVFFLIIYVLVFGVFAFSFYKFGFTWLNALAMVISIAMAYLKFKQIVDIRSKEKD